LSRHPKADIARRSRHVGFVPEGDMKARDFVAQPVKLSYDAKWEEASPAHGQIGNRCDH
jgi:hypothetical protein